MQWCPEGIHNVPQTVLECIWSHVIPLGWNYMVGVTLQDHRKLKTVKSNDRTRKPWLTTAIKNSNQYKNAIYTKSPKRPSLLNSSCYKEYKSLLNMLIKWCEKAYYEEQFKMNTNNLKRSWALIKNIIDKHKNKNVSSRFKCDGEE